MFGAASPLLHGIGGVHIKDRDIAVLDDEQRPLTAHDLPSDANSATLEPPRLWMVSEKLIS